MFGGVTNRAGVNEEEISLVVHHGVARVEVTMERTQSKHEGSVDSKQFKHVRPCEGASFKVVL